MPKGRQPLNRFMHDFETLPRDIVFKDQICTKRDLGSHKKDTHRITNLQKLYSAEHCHHFMSVTSFRAPE